MRNDFYFTAKDGVVVRCYKWGTGHGERAKGVVQIVHGSLEHALRYEHVAGFLAANGFWVYACDIRGHGRSAPTIAELNRFSHRPNGWRLALADLSRLTDRIRSDLPEMPLFLLGHSMGSFLTRKLAAERGNDYAGLLLSGTGGGNPLLIRLGLFIAGAGVLVGLRNKKNPLLHAMLYGRMNKAVENPETSSDFISRDPGVVKAYIDDPYSGGMSTTEYIREILRGILLAAKRSAYKETPAGLPILIFSGEVDFAAGPKGDSAEIRAVRDNYKKAGVSDVTLTIYPGNRHETLNELNKDRVMADILAWMEARIEARRSPRG